MHKPSRQAPELKALIARLQTKTSPANTKTPGGSGICVSPSGTGRNGTMKGGPAKKPGQGPPVDPVTHSASAKAAAGSRQNTNVRTENQLSRKNATTHLM